MRLRLPTRPASAGLLAVLTLSSGAVVTAPPASAASSPLGVTSTTDGIPTSGALFPGALDRGHGCSGTVTTIGGDSVVLTAAHCLTGTAQGWLFVPGYHDGRAPYGVYRVQGAYVDPRWKGGADWRYDAAALRLAKIRVRGGFRNIAAVTGTTVLRPAPPAKGTTVSITGYRSGVGDKALSCANRYSVRNGWGYTSCTWLPTGVSGSGMRYGNDGKGRQYLAGHIGGLHGGGCYVEEAYTPTYGSWVTELVRRARDGRPASTLPTPAPWDGCHGTRP